MAARQLAAAGFRTAILDKKKVVGEPVECAEGVSEFGLESNGLRPREEWIAQRVSGAKCVAPNGNWFYITRLPGYAIDRPAFDRWIVEGAVDDGADLRTSARVTGISRHDGGWRIEANGESMDARIVIGADGPASLIARQAGLVRRLEKIVAYEYRFRREDVPILDPDFFLLFVSQAYEGGYAWIFPKGEDVNVGAEARSTDTPRRWPSVGNSGSTSPAERRRSPARFRTGTICPPWRCPASRSSEMRAASRIR